MLLDENDIRRYLKQHRMSSALYHRLEAKWRRCGVGMPQAQVEQMHSLAELYEKVECWLQILSEDEAYVVRRHLIDDVDMKRIEAEYAERWHELTKTERTLRRYQKLALQKILDYVNQNAIELLKYHERERKN